MARPIKPGLDYYTYDCFFDDKVELILAEFSAKGIGILSMLWQKIYRGEGYYCRWDDDVALMFSRYCNEGVNVVSEVINACLRRGIFDRGMYERYQILTSKGIQKRYLEGVTRRKSVDWKKEYLLISLPSENINADNNAVNADINLSNDNINPQSKVNKSKSNKSKVNKSKSNKSSSATDYHQMLSERYSKEDMSEFYFNTPLTVAEYDYLYKHIPDFQFNKYVDKLRKYNNCQNAFETIIKWSREDGNYIENDSDNY